MAEEGVEHPYPIKAVPHKLLELLLDDLHLLLLPMGTTPRPTFLLLWPLAGERRERHLRRILDVKPLPMPPPVGVVGSVCWIRASRAQFPLQGETPHRRDLSRIPHRQGSPREQPPEEIRVWLHPKESLTNSDEADDVQHPCWIKVLQL